MGLESQPLEARKLAAPFFYRAHLFDHLWARVGDAGANVNSPQGYQTGDPTASAAASQNGRDGQGLGWVISSSVISAVTDGANLTNGTGQVSVTVSHHDSAHGFATPDPASDQNIQAVYASLVGSGNYNPGTGFNNPMTWVLAEPSSAGGPGSGSLPSGEQVVTKFHASATEGNVNLSGNPRLILYSTTMNVSVNAFTAGIVITDPTLTHPAITLPPNVGAPPGNPVYYDPKFSAAGQATVAATILTTPISSAPYTISLAYQSQLRAPAGVQLPPTQPNQPDRSWFTDGFSWTISYSPGVLNA